MRFVIFTHSLVSDWNHGNAHFLRGIAADLMSRGHEVIIYEPEDGWSRRNLLAEHGEAAIAGFEQAYPHLRSTLYSEAELDLREALQGADVVLVHEWNSHSLIERIGEFRSTHPGFQLYFHDTHHRSVTEPEAMAAYQLRHYDGVLAYGDVIRNLYRSRGWASAAWTWHESADTRVFHPWPQTETLGDLVWIGNWGDDERSEEIREFLIRPVRDLHLKARVYGVRYPEHALQELHDAGIEYGGWLPNYRAPEVYSQYRATIHIPRRPYAHALPGIPTIRPFEALACGIPMISAPWADTEGLFRTGIDYLSARNGAEMTRRLEALLSHPDLGRDVAACGLETVCSRHTCAHRTAELLALADVGALSPAGRGAR